MRPMRNAAAAEALVRGKRGALGGARGLKYCEPPYAATRNKYTNHPTPRVASGKRVIGAELKSSQNGFRGPKTHAALPPT